MLEVRTHPMPQGGFVNTYTDITERHMYAESLRQNEQWIRLITDNVPALIAYLDKNLRYRFANKVYEEWFGIPNGELNGCSINQVYTPEQFKELEPYLERVLSGESVTFEVWQTNTLGEERYMLKSYVANIDANGETDGFFVMIRDITERRRSAEALKHSHQLLEQRVEERTYELTALNEQLRSEIEERAGVEARLREAKLEADQANLSKTKFLAAVSHDLLQPLNAARLFSGALAEKIELEQHKTLASSVSNSLDDVESLLRTLVDISKLDAGVVKPDVVSFGLQSLFETLSAEYQQLATAEGLDFRYVGTRAVVKSDSQLLARILRNFLTNAIRYTQEGSVLFGCRRKGDNLIIQVWDTGPGIPAEKMSEIFQEFKRLKKDQPGQDKGLGLGLAIVDKISSVLGHEIYVESEEGRGSVFSVSVPIGRYVEPVSVVGPNIPMVTERLDGASIWLIDNDESICRGMDVLLSGWGCKVESAASVEQLRERVDFEEDKVDLLMVDYHLDNDENGIDAAKELHAEVGPHVPVLMITANYSQEVNQEIRDLGYLLINKPIKPLKLKTIMIHLLDSAEKITL